MKHAALIAEVAAMQNPWELNEALCQLERFDIETVLEIGMYQGGTFAAWSRGLLPSHLIGVTLDEVELVDIAERVRQPDDPQPRVDLIFGRSQEPAQLAAATAALDGKPVDFLFIDGGHTIEEVRADFDMYSPLVRAGGVVGIHDVNRGAVDVYEYWEFTIRQSYRSILIADALVGNAGLGIALVLV